MMLKKSISVSALVLGLFALIAAGILAITQISTRDPIAQAVREANARALLEIVPLEKHSNDLLVDTYPIPQAYWAQLGLPAGGDINLARKNDGEITAVIIPSVTLKGYSGPIRMLVGVNRDGTIAGVRVISHTETPGLGDDIELKKSPWILSFNGRSLKNPPPQRWKVEKDGGDFDQFTGATITPRAIVTQVKAVLDLVEEHHRQIFSAPVSKRAVEVEMPAAKKEMEGKR